MLIIVVSGDKGFAGAFNANILKTAYQFISGNPDKEIDVEAVGRKARDMMRRRYPIAARYHRKDRRWRGCPPGSQRTQRACRSNRRSCGHADQARNLSVEELAHSIISRYVSEEIDAAYIVYNEFKSVIQQRLVVEKLLSLIKIGAPQITEATEPTAEEKERAAEAALSAGIEIEPADEHEAEEEAKKFGTANVDYIYEQPPEELLARPASAIHFCNALPRHDGIGGRRTRRPHDRHGFGDQQRLRHD